jgi:S1-C subfamily serine protease
MWMWGGVSLEDHPRGIRVSHLSPNWFKMTNRDARRVLRAGDIILEIDGKTGWTRSTYIAYFMRQKKLGSTIRLKIERDGKTLAVSFRLPTERPEIQSG